MQKPINTEPSSKTKPARVVKALPTTSLACTLWLAAQGAFAISEEGCAADDWLSNLSADQRPAVQHYLYTSLRWWWRSEGILRFCMSSPPPVELQMLMSVVLASIIELDQALVSTQLSAAQHDTEVALLVNQTIEAIKYVESGRFAFFAGVANAVLRRVLR